MTEGLPEVPDWIDDKIKFREDRDVQDHHFVDVFQKIEQEKPFLSVSTVQSELGMSPEGVRQRLEPLVEIDVLDSCAGANGRLYLIKDDRSDWPIPPDVAEVESVEDTDELTVSELVERSYVKAGALAVAAGMAGSVLLTVLVTTLFVEVPLSSGWADLLFILALVSAIAGVGFGLGGLLLFAYENLRE